MSKVVKYYSLSSEDLEKIREKEGVKILLTEHHPIHNTHQTDDFGNEISEQEYMYDIVVEIVPTTLGEACTIENFLDSLTSSGKGKDHRADVYGADYQSMIKDIEKLKSKKKKLKRLQEEDSMGELHND